MTFYKIHVINIGDSWINPAIVIAVLPAMEGGKQIVGHSTIVSTNGPPMSVKGKVEDVVRALEGTSIIETGGN